MVWYALFVNGMFYSAAQFAEMVEMDIKLFKDAARNSGVHDSLSIRFVKQTEAARLLSAKNYYYAIAA